MIQYVLAFVLALLAVLVLTPLVRKAAIRFGFVDHPDGGRKAHENPIALGGGAAIFVAILVSIAATFVYAYVQGELTIGIRATDSLLALFAASIIIVGVGLIDDIYSLPGRYKLLGQILASSVLIAAGLQIEGFKVGGFEFVLGWAMIPFTLFWLLGSINAINLIDGIDGLASSLGFVLCLTFAAVMARIGHVEITILMLALGGSLLGFLKFNFAPASIFLGDAGSMLIGLIIGAAAIFTKTKGAAIVALAVPVAVWSIPILDSAAAILRRKLTGRSVFAADRGHMHHSLLVRGWTVRQAVLFIGLIAATTCLSAFLSFYYKNELIALVTVAAMSIFLVVTKTFGHIEFALVKHHLRWTAHALSSSSPDDENQIHESSIHLQGSCQWDELWSALIESAQSFHLVRLMLNINIPSLHEAFFATWDCKVSKHEAENAWKIKNSLVVNGQVVGNIEIVGSASGGSAFPHMIQVLDFVEAIESAIRQTMGEIQQAQDEAVGDSQNLAASTTSKPVVSPDAPSDAPPDATPGPPTDDSACSRDNESHAEPAVR